VACLTLRSACAHLPSRYIGAEGAAEVPFPPSVPPLWWPGMLPPPDAPPVINLLGFLDELQLLKVRPFREDSGYRACLIRVRISSTSMVCLLFRRQTLIARLTVGGMVSGVAATLAVLVRPCQTPSAFCAILRRGPGPNRPWSTSQRSPWKSG
jgi:hypothetical protein